MVLVQIVEMTEVQDPRLLPRSSTKDLEAPYRSIKGEPQRLCRSTYPSVLTGLNEKGGGERETRSCYS